MLKIPKILASILAVSSSLTSTPAFCSLLYPYQDGAWEVGVSALYLQPSFAGNGLGYSSYSSYAGADNSGSIQTMNGSNHINNITPEWDFEFELEGTYYFNVGNDLNLAWYHLNNDVDGQLPPGSLFSGSVDGYYAGSLQLATKWDAVNLELGKHIQMGDCKLLRLHVGAAFARIKNRFTNYPRIFDNGDTYFISFDTLSYTGWGPRLGADFEYGLQSGFGVYVKTAGSVLVGTAKQTVSGYQDYSNAVYGLIPFGIDNYTLSNHHVVVPEVEAKLGITYDYKLAGGNLGIDLGYLWMNYLSALSSYTGIGIVGSSIGIPATTNFNLNGLYLGLTWVGNW